VQKVIIFGNGIQAELIYGLLTHDSPYKVVAFTVDQAYIKEETLCGLPVVPFEQVEAMYPPTIYKMSLFLSYREVNQFRAKKYSQAKAKGYDLLSYVSPHAVTWPGLVIGDNCFIGELSVIQPFVEIGSNIIIVAGSIVGHHSVIKDHCFISGGTVILGKVTVEPFCFLGANCTIKQGITIGRGCIIGAGSYISKDTQEKGVYITKPAELMPKSSDEWDKLLTWDQDMRRTKINPS
jgi:sugar O-acyltransferase (sialic acid O-acetyltransferase NeuD family)